MLKFIPMINKDLSKKYRVAFYIRVSTEEQRKD